MFLLHYPPSRRHFLGLVAILVGTTVATMPLLRCYGCMRATPTNGELASVFDHGTGSLPFALLRCDRSLPEALLHAESAVGGGELRHSDCSLSLTPRGGPSIGQSVLQQRRLGCRHSACPRLTLEVLFCTRQT
ncbi:MAG: hypothetical protein ABFC63_06290 [Thermoguttaceae bacterium]